MSGRVGLREESRQAHLLAQRIAQLFPLPGDEARRCADLLVAADMRAERGQALRVRRERWPASTGAG